MEFLRWAQVSSMAKVNSQKFLLLAKQSGLVSAEDVARCQASLAEVNKELPEDPNVVADLMIENRLLNRWQADNLLKGKYKGFKLGKYRLMGHLGTGGMSSVYLAEHSVMERLVAIKVLPKRYIENPNYLGRFKREARAVAALDHPNIVRAYDIDQDGKTHYIVMEYVEGRDLQRMVKDDGVLDPIDAADFIAQAALGLQHAHEAGLIHRDVKPANCLVDHRKTLKLLDLGLAKFSEDQHPSISAVHEDSVVGTADYLAPEQARNSQTVDSRADIYGLGCTLYFCLTGNPPFPEGTITQRLLKHQNEVPPSLYETRPDVPPALVSICERMMAKGVDERMQTATEVAQVLGDWLATRGRKLSAVYTANTDSSPTSADTSLGGRFSRTFSTQSGSGSGSGGSPSASDTVSSSLGDTTAGDSRNDDLTLAPIDDEHPRDETPSGSSLIPDYSEPTPPPIAGDGSSSGVLDTASDRPLVETNLDVIDPTDYGSGPLDALLEDPSFSSGVELPKTQLGTRSRKGIHPLWWVLVGGLAALFIAIVIIIALSA